MVKVEERCVHDCNYHAQNTQDIHQDDGSLKRYPDITRVQWQNGGGGVQSASTVLKGGYEDDLSQARIQGPVYRFPGPGPVRPVHIFQLYRTKNWHEYSGRIRT